MIKNLGVKKFFTSDQVLRTISQWIGLGSFRLSFYEKSNPGTFATQGSFCLSVHIFFIFVFSGFNCYSQIPNSEWVFEITNEIKRHRSQVVTNGIAIVENFSHFFPELGQLSSELRQRLVSSYLSAHDAPKLWSREQLDTYDYVGELTPFENIVKFWGRELTPNERNWVGELNRVEMLYKADQLIRLEENLKIRLSRKLIAELSMIESVADIFDTKLNRAAELRSGKFFTQFETTEFFKRKNQPRLANLALQLEIHLLQRSALCPLLF